MGHDLRASTEEPVNEEHDDLIEYLETIIRNQNRISHQIAHSYRPSAFWENLFSLWGVIIVCVVCGTIGTILTK